MLGVVNEIWKIVAEFVPFITSSPPDSTTRRASAAIAARRYQDPESSSQPAGKNVSSRTSILNPWTPAPNDRNVENSFFPHSMLPSKPRISQRNYAVSPQPSPFLPPSVLSSQ